MGGNKVDKYEKIRFFKELDQLNCLSDSDEETTHRNKDQEFPGLVSADSSGKEVTSQPAGLRTSSKVPRSGDSLSLREPDLKSTPHSCAMRLEQTARPRSGSDKDGNGDTSTTSLVADFPKSLSTIATVKRTRVTAGLRLSEESKTEGHGTSAKRRKMYIPRSIPEDQQLFRGLSFC